MMTNYIYLLLALVASVKLCTCDRDPLSYMPMKDKTIPVREFNWIVEQIDSGRWGKDIETVAAGLKEAAQTASLIRLGYPFQDKYGVTEFKFKGDGREGNQLYEALSHFERLSNQEVGTSRDCSPSDVRFLINLTEIKFGGLKKFLATTRQQPPAKGNGLTLAYLAHFVPKFYTRCLSRLGDEFIRALDNLDSLPEDRMDRMVLIDRQYPSEKPDTFLAQEAEKLDLAKGKFDAVKMVKIVGEYLGTEGKHCWLKSGSAHLLNDFVRGACIYLRLWLEGPFDIYNMARVLVPEEAAKLEMTSKFRKLNEYSRICIPYRRGSATVFNNIKSNMIRIGIKSTLGWK